MICVFQGVVKICDFDVITSFMTLSGIWVTPRKGHLDRVNMIYEFFYKMCQGTIHVWKDEPDYLDYIDP